MRTVHVQLELNGRSVALDVAPQHTLLDVLRDEVGLTGSKACCLVGECGACTVLVGERSVDACLVLAAEADGWSVTTVEGLAPGNELHPLQSAFLATGAAQCGFCIPGQLMAAAALLAHDPHPTRAEIEDGLAGNYCRCAGYGQIFEAVELAAEELAAVEQAAAADPAAIGRAAERPAR